MKNENSISLIRFRKALSLENSLFESIAFSLWKPLSLSLEGTLLKTRKSLSKCSEIVFLFKKLPPIFDFYSVISGEQRTLENFTIKISYWKFLITIFILLKQFFWEWRVAIQMSRRLSNGSLVRREESLIFEERMLCKNKILDRHKH